MLLTATPSLRSHQTLPCHTSPIPRAFAQMSKEAASEVTGSFSHAIGLKKDERPVNQLTRDKHMKRVKKLQETP